MSAGERRRRLDWILSPEPGLQAGGPGSGLCVGVLALQGDFREHRVMLERLGARTREVRQAVQLDGMDGLVIPGGESTTIARLMDAYGLSAAIVAFHAAGGAVFGTCAGLITVASGTVEGTPPTLGLMDIVARRNAFGRQVRSFEADLEVREIGPEPMRAVFIRAPWVESAGQDVETLAVWEGHVVAARQGRVLVTAFHPELTDDTRLHEQFIAMIRRESAVEETDDAAPPRVVGRSGQAFTVPVNR